MRIRDENKEKAIRKQALEMIVRGGLDGLSMQKLAHAANVSPATIYLYFENREDLILQLYAEINKKMADATLKDFDPDMHFDEGLKVQWRNRADYCLQYPDQLYFMEQIRHSPLIEKAFALIDKTFLEAMGRFTHNAIERGELRRMPREVYWSMAFAPLYQLISFHKLGRGLNGEAFKITDETLQQALELVIKALKP